MSDALTREWQAAVLGLLSLIAAKHTKHKPSVRRETERVWNELQAAAEAEWAAQDKPSAMIETESDA